MVPIGKGFPHRFLQVLCLLLWPSNSPSQSHFPEILLSKIHFFHLKPSSHDYFYTRTNSYVLLYPLRLKKHSPEACIYDLCCDKVKSVEDGDIFCRCSWNALWNITNTHIQSGYLNLPSLLWEIHSSRNAPFLTKHKTKIYWHYKYIFRIKDITDIIANCASTHWADRKDGLIGLQCFFRDGRWPDNIC